MPTRKQKFAFLAPVSGLFWLGPRVKDVVLYPPGMKVKLLSSCWLGSNYAAVEPIGRFDLFNMSKFIN